jgi:transcriptional regulator with XRE-family HTH domain
MDQTIPSNSGVSGSEKGVPRAPFELGARLRAIRLRHGVGLRELARRLELSPSSISQIETGKIQPSVRTLYALTTEFGVPVDDVLFGEDPVALSRQPTNQLSGATASMASDAAAGPGVTVQRAHERPAITLNSGVTWERLMFWAEDDVEFIEATYKPGGASSTDGELVRHSGREFGCVLSGTLRVVVGFEEYVLEAGDSITFPSSRPHLLRNDSDEPARAIWVVRGRPGVSGDEVGAAARHLRSADG